MKINDEFDFSAAELFELLKSQNEFALKTAIEKLNQIRLLEGKFKYEFSVVNAQS